MNFLNLHSHDVEIFVYESEGFKMKEKLPRSTGVKSNNYHNLYCIVCNDCDYLYKDYESNFKIKISSRDRYASLFGKNDRPKMFTDNKNSKFFEPVELNNYFLIGTKNEIISYLLKKCISSKNEITSNSQETNITLKNKNMIQQAPINNNEIYDIILNINSFKSLVGEGWKIIYNRKEGKKNYLKNKNELNTVIGFLGNCDKGKSFILGKLFDIEIPKGSKPIKEGLGILYSKLNNENISIINNLCGETPLLFSVRNKNLNMEEDNEINNEYETEQKNFEEYSKDKLYIENFLQNFVIYKSNILILVVGKITLQEQKLLAIVKNEVRELEKKRQIYVIHNLKEFTEEEQVNNYIENTLKKLYNLEIKENIYEQFDLDSNNENKEYFEKYFTEKDKSVKHFIFINRFSEKAKYYNEPVIRFIRQEISSVKEKKIFPVIDDCKQFLVKMSEEIMKETPTIKDLTTIENENYDRIVLKNIKEINLKKFVIDEMGYTLYNDTSDPKYSYYIKKEEKMFYVNIELPGGGKVIPKIEIKLSNYYFIYEGIKNGDELVENDKNSETKKLIAMKNLRERKKFKIVIPIPCSTMQLKIENDEDLDDLGEVSNDGKGVYTWKYKVIIVGDKKEKKKQKTLDL